MIQMMKGGGSGMMETRRRSKSQKHLKALLNKFLTKNLANKKT